MVICRLVLNMIKKPPAINVSGINSEEAAALTAEFMGLDKDNNGIVSVDELEGVLRSMRINLMLSETAIKQTIRKIDINGDGIIDLAELNGVLEKYDTEGTVYKALKKRSELRKEFRKYDADNSGYISKDELLQVINERTGVKVSEMQLEHVMKESDDNDDGRINYDEFCTMMTKSFMKRKVFTKRM